MPEIIITTKKEGRTRKKMDAVTKADFKWMYILNRLLFVCNYAE